MTKTISWSPGNRAQSCLWRHRIRKFCRISRVLWRHRQTGFPVDRLVVSRRCLWLFFVSFSALPDGLDKNWSSATIFANEVSQVYSTTDIFPFRLRGQQFGLFIGRGFGQSSPISHPQQGLQPAWSLYSLPDWWISRKSRMVVPATHLFPPRRNSANFHGDENFRRRWPSRECDRKSRINNHQTIWYCTL